MLDNLHEDGGVEPDQTTVPIGEGGLEQCQPLALARRHRREMEAACRGLEGAKGDVDAEDPVNAPSFKRACKSLPPPHPRSSTERAPAARSAATIVPTRWSARLIGLSSASSSASWDATAASESLPPPLQ